MASGIIDSSLIHFFLVANPIENITIPKIKTAMIVKNDIVLPPISKKLAQHLTNQL